MPQKMSKPTRSPYYFLLPILLLLASCGQTQIPQNFTIRTIDGKQHSLNGSQPGPVLVHFWSTTCGVCIEEMPQLNQLYHSLHQQGVNIIAVALASSPPNAVVAMVERLNMPFPVALDLDNRISNTFGSVEATPTTVLLSKQGRILSRHVGGGHVSEITDSIKELIEPQTVAGKT